ncbi:GNAT family N-acetyltransferase [Sphingobacterium faecium]|uniref:GNAT family N-acetyltransferase n=1 Tax=Sphingobacterium faecium TaxID=34087 RepID=UPI003207B610
MLFINYTAFYKEKCIEIFKSNLPIFFDQQELPLFENFLDHHTHENYYLIKESEQILACGGIFIDEVKGEASLAWGMVHAQHHKKGIGKLLTQYRLAIMKKCFPNKTYVLETSQHTAAFYEKNGFHTIAIVQDGFGKGIDKYMMKMKNK